MSILTDLIHDIAIPDLHPAWQSYPEDGIADIPAAVLHALDNSEIAQTFSGGDIAIGVGSRGVANIPVITRTVAAWFRNRGGAPFVIPCMGSHGGATAEGQAAMLAELGVTESAIGCPIRSSMEVVLLGHLENGLPVYMDALAWETKNVFVINRIKPHTSFSGANESGLLKMLTIGLGKQKGADAAHSFGNASFAAIMPDMARMCITRKPGILGGLALIENERDQTCLIEAVPAPRLETRDAQLLTYAKSRMPSIPLDSIDLLIVDRIGKNISGSGMDPNITGRHGSPAKSGGPDVSRLVVLQLTPESKGTATGVGMADIVPRSLVDAINFEYTYANVITSNNLAYVRLPMILETEQDAIRCGIKTCMGKPGELRIVRVRDTLSVDKMLVSRAAADAFPADQQCTVAACPMGQNFSADGVLDKTVWQTAFN